MSGSDEVVSYEASGDKCAMRYIPPNAQLQLIGKLYAVNLYLSIFPW